MKTTRTIFLFLLLLGPIFNPGTPVVTYVTSNIQLDESSSTYLTRRSFAELASPYEILRIGDDLWFSEYNVNVLHRYNLITKNLTSFDLPADITPLELRLEDNKSLWFTDYDFTRQVSPVDHLVRFDLQNYSISMIDLPPDASPLTFEIRDGLAYVTMIYDDLVAVYDLHSNASYELPLNDCPGFCGPAGLGFDSNGTLWVVITLGGAFAKYNNQTGNFTYYDAPWDFISPSYLSITEDDILWTGSHGGDRVLRFDLKDKSMKQFISPQPSSDQYPSSGVNDIKIAPNGDVWFAEHFIPRVGRLHLASGTIQEYHIPNKKPLIQTLYIDNTTVWFPEEGGYISSIDLASAPTFSVSQVGNISAKHGSLNTLKFDVKYISGGYDQIDFNLFAEVRGIDALHIVRESHHKLSRGDSSQYKLRFYILDDFPVGTFNIVYGIRADTFTATQQCKLTVSESRFYSLKLFAFWFVVLLIPVLIISTIYRKFFSKKPVAE